MFLLEALLDATTVPDEEDDAADVVEVDNVLNGVPEMEVNTKFL